MDAMPAKICPNCGNYLLPPRCGMCGWSAVIVTDDDSDDDVDEPTTDEPTRPDLGGSD